MYVEAGADAIFAEALHEVGHFRMFVRGLNAPVLANLTEFGKTPLFTIEEMRGAGVAMVLYPLSAFRAMNEAARQAYVTIRNEGTQSSLVGRMQTRDELYKLLDYYRFEQLVDRPHGDNRSEGTER